MKQSKTTNELLFSFAKQYNQKEFIQKDPISFPHRFKEKKDIEISAFISSWIAYGNRKAILQTLSMLHQEYEEKFANSPFLFIKQRGFEQYKDNQTSLYRFYKWNDYYDLCQRLYTIYISENNQSMEEKILAQIKSCQIDPLHKTDNPFFDVLTALTDIFQGVKGVPKDTSSACKRLCMFLRWLIRDDGIVDFGLWKIIKPQDLIIPLDTHVFQMAKNLSLTQRNSADMRTAIEITQGLKEIFPQDPAKGDFSLFGYGVEHQNAI